MTGRIPSARKPSRAKRKLRIKVGKAPFAKDVAGDRAPYRKLVSERESTPKDDLAIWCKLPLPAASAGDALLEMEGVKHFLSLCALDTVREWIHHAKFVLDYLESVRESERLASDSAAIKTISALGKKAGVKTWTNARGGKVKYATAHDLRRAFGIRCPSE